MTLADGLTAIDSTVFTVDCTSETKTISVYTADFAKAATYSMMAKACYTDVPTKCGSRTFTIIVNNPCLSDTLTIDATKFATPALTYNVKSTAGVLNWTDANAASTGGFTTICGAFTWTVTKIDGTAIDSTVFTGVYTGAAKTISTYTTDFTKANNYTM